MKYKNANVLITSSGDKINLIEAFKSAIKKIDKNYKLIAGDSSSTALSRFFADEFWEMPAMDDISIDTILTFCLDKKIKCIFPTRDNELLFWANQRQTFKKNGINVIISDAKAINTCLDKLEFFKRSYSKNYNLIPTSTRVDDLDCDLFVVKERFGSGSKNIGIKLNKSDAQSHANTLICPIFQPFIEGVEISIDAWVYKNHLVKGLVLRSRDLISNGESKITTTFKNQIIEKQCIEFIESLKLYGPVVVQAIVDDLNKLHFIECNARFGGASTASIVVGLDSLFWSFLDSLDKDVSSYNFNRSILETKQIRVHRDEQFHVD